MQNHPGTFRAFFATLAAAVFLALTLSSCAVTVALPGGGSTTTTPIPQPPTTGTGSGTGGNPTESTPTTDEDQSPEDTDKKGASDIDAGKNGGEKEPSDDKEPGNENKDNQPETSDSNTGEVGGSENGKADDSKKPESKKPGDDMDVPKGYDATWKLDGNTLVLNTYTLPSGSDLSVKLPTGGKYKIGDSAFAGKSQIASIEIPDDVIEIGNYAFTDTRLESIEIPQSVKVIGDYAFAQTQLQSLTLKGNYTSKQLGKYAFSSCEMLEKIIFTGTATELPEGIFSYTSITSFTLPKGLQTIHAKAFDYTYLSEIYIPCNVTEIDLSAFNNTAVTIHYAGTDENWSAIAKGNLPEGVAVKCNSKAPNEDTLSLLTALF